MSGRIEAIDPARVVDAASAVLRAAWAPPCLHYTPEYLGWQFRYPGEPPALGVLATEGGAPVGFAAVVPRRVRCGGESRAIRLLSFVAVDPAARGRGQGRRLYEELLGRIAEPATPVVAYAVPGSGGERRLLEAFERAGYGRAGLGECRAHGGIPRGGGGSAGTIDESADADQLGAAVRRGGDAETLRLDPDAGQWAHGRDAAAGRGGALIRGAGVEPAGVVQVAPAESLSAVGVDRLAVVTSLALIEPSADALRAALSYAASRAGAGATSPMVVLQNPSGIDAATLRSAGLRALPTVLAAYLFTPPGCAGFPTARRCAVDVV